MLKYRFPLHPSGWAGTKGHKRRSKAHSGLVPFGFRKEKDTQERRTAALKRWLKRIFYNPRHSKPADENILRLLMPSVVGIFICMVCLAGSTWAWFSSSVQTAPQTIEAASFDISAAVIDASGQPVPSGQPLQAGQKYTVTLTAAGNAPSGGYCEVESGAVFLYTETILPNELLAFTLIPDSNAAYTFTAVWGKYSGKPDITDGCTIEAEQPETGDETPALPANGQNAAEYVVQSGDTLGKIAQEYGTAVEKLAAYNGIENPNEIQIGQTFKIPPEDYEIPSPPAVSGGKDEPAQQPAEAEEPAEETPPEQANPVTETMPADTPAVLQPTSAASPESTESTGSEPPEPDLSETDETNEPQNTEAPAT